MSISISISIYEQLCVIQTFQVADLMLTVRPLVVSVLFIRIKKFLSLVCSVSAFLLRPESNTTLLTWVIHRSLSGTKNILKIQRTAELRKHTDGLC